MTEFRLQVCAWWGMGHSKWGTVNEAFKSQSKCSTNSLLKLLAMSDPLCYKYNTCIWYWRGTCRSNAVGPGHNCTLSGSLSKETYKVRQLTSKTFHCKTRNRLTCCSRRPETQGHDRIACVSNDMKNNGIWTDWILTRVKATVAESTICLPSHHQTTEDGKRRKWRLRSWNQKGKIVLPKIHWQ